MNEDEARERINQLMTPKILEGYAALLYITTLFCLLSYYIPALLLISFVCSFYCLDADQNKALVKRQRLIPPIALSFVYVLTLPIIYKGMEHWLTGSGEMQYFSAIFPSPSGHIYAAICYSVHLYVAATVATVAIKQRHKFIKDTTANEAD